MKTAVSLFLRMLVLLARILRPGGVKAVIAENLMLKHQITILQRSRKRAPNLEMSDRVVLGWLSLVVSPNRLRSISVVVKPATLLKFHRAMVKRKYQRLYGHSGQRRPGPKGPSKELIAAIVERLIGTIRREYLDHVPFWNSLDLQRKLNEFKDYYNNHRSHSALSGQSPEKYNPSVKPLTATLSNYSWRSHCRDLFQTPIPA
jgi:hypothetical protein